MAIGKFFQRLFGDEPEVEMSSDPFPTEKQPTAAVAPPPAAARPTAVVHREEIIDGRSRIGGYRFNPRLLASGERPDPEAAIELLKAEAIGQLAQRRLALVPLDSRDWASHDYRQFVAPHTAFLVDLPAYGVSEEEWLATLHDIRASGAKIACTDAAAALPIAREMADVFVINFENYPLEAFEQLVADLKRSRPELQLVAENVRTWPEHRLCQSRGMHYSLGDFATSADEEDTTEKLNHSHLVLIELLNLLRHDADTAELADVAKRDPAVALKLVSLANSPLSGLEHAVTSLDQAITVLGRSYIYRWMTIAMFRVSGNSRDEGLLELALHRARFLEDLGETHHQRKEADELFLVGLLSLIDVLLGTTMEKIIERMHLPAEVTNVLVNSDGPYGRYLLLAIALERGRTEQVARQAAALGFNAADLDAAHAEARQWAEAAMGIG